MTRLYQPIWEKLKSLDPKIATSTGVTITSRAFTHRRIIKAVIKEKYNDVGYKIMLKEEKDKTARLDYSISGTTITFRLIFSMGIKDLS